MLRARDLGVSLVALTAAFLALQGTPDVDVQLRWTVGERPLPKGGANLPVPVPLVTDLDGDGNNEVVVLADGGMTVRVLSIPQASGETLVEPVTLHEAKLAPSSQLPGEMRAVAMAAGYLEPPPVDATAKTADVRRLSISASTATASRQQHLVVVREDWSVVCFDHQLKTLWKADLLDHHQSLGEGFGKTYVIDQVAITVTHSVRKLDDRGVPKGGAADGLVVVGASMRHRDGRFHHSRAGQDHDPNKSGAASAGRADDPLGVHVEAFVEGEEDSRDSAQEAEMTQDDKNRRAAQHFSLFALDGDSGDVRWQHLGGGGGALPGAGEQEKRGEDGGGGEGHETEKTPWTNADPSLDLSGFGFAVGSGFFHDGTAAGPDFEGLAAAAGSAGAGGGRRFRRSLLSHLPHAWSAPSDTRLEITALRRRGPGGGGKSNARSGSLGAGDGRDRGATGRRASEVGADGPDGVAAAAAAVGGGAEGGGVVRVVLARTREGLEAVELSTGRPLSAVALPAAGSGTGVYADLNGDGVVDHVQAVGTLGDQGWGHLQSGLAMGHLSEQASPSQAQQASRLPPCYALAVSGLHAKEQLFNGSLCHGAGALMDIEERLNKQPSRRRSRDEEVGAASPVVFRRGPPGAAPAAAAAARSHGGTGPGTGETAARNSAGLGARSDVVFAVSSGVVSSYDDEGRLLWQDRRGPTWARSGPEERESDNNANSMGNSMGGYVVPLTLEVDKRGNRGGGGGVGTSHGAEERILVVGKDKMCVYDRRGRLVGSTILISGPSQRPVVGDFDGDGMADVLVVGWSGAAAGYALSPDPGVRVLFVAVLVLAAAMLLVAAVHAPPPPSASLLSSSRRGDSARSGREGGRRGVPVGRKSKRATD